MGPQRQNWTFPKRAEFLIEALEAKIKRLAQQIDEKLDEEQLQEAEIVEFRERLAAAGVERYATAYPEGIRSGWQSSKRTHYTRLATTLATCESYLEAIRQDQVRDPDRLYRLTYDDLEWFGL